MAASNLTHFDSTQTARISYDPPMPEGHVNTPQNCPGCGGDFSLVRHEGQCPFCRAQLPKNIGINVSLLVDIDLVQTPTQTPSGLVNCIACGYSIQDLSGRVERCPECGTKLADMVGDFFAGCDILYIKRMLRGISLLLAANICSLMLPLLLVAVLYTRAIRLNEQGFAYVAAGLLAVPSVLAWMGMHFMTTPHPVFETTCERREKFKKSRLFARRAAHCWFVLSVLIASLSFAGNEYSMLATVCALASSVLFGWTSIGYFRTIADCCADVNVAKAVRRSGWLAPIFLLGPPLAIAIIEITSSFVMRRPSSDLIGASICCIPITCLVAWAFSIVMLSEVSQLLRRQVRVQKPIAPPEL